MTGGGGGVLDLVGSMDLGAARVVTCGGLREERGLGTEEEERDGAIQLVIFFSFEVGLVLDLLIGQVLSLGLFG